MRLNIKRKSRPFVLRNVLAQSITQSTHILSQPHPTEEFPGTLVLITGVEGTIPQSMMF